MFIKSLTLKNFRNYTEESIRFSENTNVLFGDNAQGKTNIIEALFLFALGRSFRTSRDRELILFNEDVMRAELIFSDNRRENQIEIIVRKDRKKQIKINGVVISKLGDLLGKFNVVLFFPEDLNLVKEGPGLRRRFLDVAISQLRPNYYHCLSKYNKVLEQRNNLIRKIKYQNYSAETLFVWDEKLCEYAMRLYQYRGEYIEKFLEHAKQVHKEICGEDLEIYYNPRFKSCDAFLNRLQMSRKSEIEQGCCNLGPHRDDFSIFINGRDAKSFASQGQQRTVVLSMKIAQAEYIFKESGEYPVLLFDDVMSELDAGRRKYLSSKIKDKQVVITCTDIDALELDEYAKTMQVKNGRVKE